MERALRDTQMQLEIEAARAGPADTLVDPYKPSDKELFRGLCQPYPSWGNLLRDDNVPVAVSYTHLTLPTSDLV